MMMMNTCLVHGLNSGCLFALPKIGPFKTKLLSFITLYNNNNNNDDNDNKVDNDNNDDYLYL